VDCSAVLLEYLTAGDKVSPRGAGIYPAMPKLQAGSLFHEEDTPPLARKA